MGGRVKWGIVIKECTWHHEHRVTYGSAGLLYCTLETNITLYADSNGIKKDNSITRAFFFFTFQTLLILKCPPQNWQTCKKIIFLSI